MLVPQIDSLVAKGTYRITVQITPDDMERPMIDLDFSASSVELRNAAGVVTVTFSTI